MQDLFWKCKICDACGVCGRSEAECEIYHEYYGMGEAPVVKTCAATGTSGSVLVQEKVPTQKEVLEKAGLINRLTGKIVNIVKGDNMAQITIKVGENYISSILPRGKFEETGKREGDTITTVFKAVNVKIMR